MNIVKIIRPLQLV